MNFTISALDYEKFRISRMIRARYAELKPDLDSPEGIADFSKMMMFEVTQSLPEAHRQICEHCRKLKMADEFYLIRSIVNEEITGICADRRQKELDEMRKADGRIS